MDRLRQVGQLRDVRRDAIDRHGRERHRRHARKRLVERHGPKRRAFVRGDANARPTARRLQRRHVDGGGERPDVEGEHQPHHLHGAPRHRKIRRAEVARRMEHSHLRRLGLGRRRGGNRPVGRPARADLASRRGARGSVGGQRHQPGGEHVHLRFWPKHERPIRDHGERQGRRGLEPHARRISQEREGERRAIRDQHVHAQRRRCRNVALGVFDDRLSLPSGQRRYADRHGHHGAVHHGRESVLHVHGIEQRRHVHGIGRPLQQDPRLGSADAAEQPDEHSHRRSELREARLAGGRLDDAALIRISAGRPRPVHEDHARRSRQPANVRSVSRHLAQLFLHEQLGFPRHL